MGKTACFLMIFCLLDGASTAQGKKGRTENIILMTLDGARTQEIFGGLDLEVLRSITKKGNVEETRAYKKYWAPTPQQRREKMMPFFWGVLMKQHGSIAGNRELGSAVEVTNQMRFSYPGYSEILTGQAHDDVINSNDKKRNPYASVLEFLKRKLGLKASQVAAFASWDTMDWIAQHEPGSITSNAGFEPYEHPDPIIRAFSKLQMETDTPWDGVRHDAYTYRFAKAHLKQYRPRVLFVSLGETDDWAHDGNYERVLDALARTDMYLRDLWQFLNEDKEYRGRTSILITVDHGRGNTNWTDHGEKVPEARSIWMAFASPDSELRGEWSNTETIYQNQVAATLCRFLGLDYGEQNRQAGKPIAHLFSPASNKVSPKE